MEFSPVSFGFKNSTKEKTVSPRTPKTNSKAYKRENTSENKIYINTPENCKLYYNIFAEESPQNYYDHCTLSQKMIIDEERDVTWNWDNPTNKSVKTLSNKFLKELQPTTKSIFKKRQYQVKRRIKVNNVGEGLNKLQALQEEIMAKSLQNHKYDNSVKCPKEENNYELNENAYNGYYKILEIKSNKCLNQEDDFENSKNKINKVSKNDKHFYSEEDEILFQHSQIIENYDVLNLELKSKNNSKYENQIKHDEIKINFKDLTNIAALNKAETKTNFSNNCNQTSKNLETFECEEAFDDIFLTIDLSSIGESNKKFQFQRHNSMPHTLSKTDSNLKRFGRHNSANNFQENKIAEKDTLIPTKIDVPNNLEFSEEIDRPRQNFSTKFPKRCSREEVEAKRLEAKRKRLLKIKKNI